MVSNEIRFKHSLLFVRLSVVGTVGQSYGTKTENLWRASSRAVASQGQRGPFNHQLVIELVIERAAHIGD